MSEHTPGPWEAKPGIAPQWIVEAKDTFICQTIDWYERHQEGNDESNAHLIAAAPDLLEACKHLVQMFSGRQDESTVEIKILTEGTAAIAKAKPRGE